MRQFGIEVTLLFCAKDKNYNLFLFLYYLQASGSPLLYTVGTWKNFSYSVTPWSVLFHEKSIDIYLF
jgi:hypothetical protein